MFRVSAEPSPSSAACCVLTLAAAFAVAACVREQPQSGPDAKAKSPAPALSFSALPTSPPVAKEPQPAVSPAQRAFEPAAKFHFPTNLSPGERVPFVLVLHGFGVSSALLLAKSNLAAFADEKHFAFAVPDGSKNPEGRPFWNAGPSCCDSYGSGVDDVARLTALLDAARARPEVDPKRVFVIGYSNGGFMAHRLACESGDRISAMISVSGSLPGAPCPSSAALSVLEIHGDADPFVHYEGGRVLGLETFAEHPSALETVRTWARRLHCSGEPQRLEPRDLEPSLKGAETTVQAFTGCQGGDVQLWTVRGGKHYIALERPAFEAMWQFLQERAR